MRRKPISPPINNRIDPSSVVTSPRTKISPRANLLFMDFRRNGCWPDLALPLMTTLTPSPARDTRACAQSPKCFPVIRRTLSFNNYACVLPFRK